MSDQTDNAKQQDSSRKIDLRDTTTDGAKYNGTFLGPQSKQTNQDN